MSQDTQRMATRVDLRQAIEKEVLTYLTALQYDQQKDKLAEERKTTFTPLPKLNAPKNDPASKSCLAIVDVDEEDPMPQSGHYYVPDSPTGWFKGLFHLLTNFLTNESYLEWDQTFDAVYDASCMMNARFNIGHLVPGLAGMTNSIIKTVLMHPNTTFADLYEEMAGCIKTMDGHELPKGCSSLVFALRDNGSALTE